MISLSVNNLCYHAGSFSLSPVSFEISKGSYVCIVGATGSGKTVLLELLAGIRKAENGTVSFNGSDITDIPSEHRNIGFAYQDSLLFPFLSVEENILFGAKIKGKFHDTDVRSRYASLLKRLHIGHLVSRKPHFLSGGERQRVSLARALLLRPKLLLLDEPLSALDADCRDEMQSLLKEIHHADDCPVIHVTHDMTEVDRLASECFVMKNGCLSAR